MPRPKRVKPASEIITRKNAAGILEGISTVTGEVVWTEKKKTHDRRGRRMAPRAVKFSTATMDKILQEICEGNTITGITRIPGMPNAASIHKWRRENPEFEVHYQHALKVRAEFFADKVADIANQDTISKDRAPGERLKAELYQWHAEVNDRATYGKQTKISGDPNAPLQIIVDTGIQRSEPPAIEVESQEIPE